MSCIVVQGPLYDKCMPYLLEDYKDYPHKILSTWNTEDQEKIQKLKENGFRIVLNDYPSPRSKINHQALTTKTGTELAKTLGYTHIFRFRSDVHCNNINKLMSIYESYDKDKLVFLTWFQSPDHNPPHIYHAYLMDHIVYGPTDKIFKYYNVLGSHQEYRHSEKFFQEMYFGKENLVYDHIREEVRLCINDLINKDITFFYTKPGTEDHGELLYRYTHCNHTCMYN